MRQIRISTGPLKERADQVVKVFRDRNCSIVTAESCTAGLLAALLSKADGASEVLKGGFIWYTKDHKTAALGVSAHLLKTKTAVASEVAAAMALGALKHSNADVALAVTGVLGPEPDEDGNPVGLVYLARRWRAGEEKILRFDFGDLPHEKLCRKSLEAALDLLAI